MKKNTQELLKVLKNTRDIKDYLSDYSDEFAAMPLPDYLEKLLIEKNIKKSQCILQAKLYELGEELL